MTPPPADMGARTPDGAAARPNLDPAELQRFAALAADWWDPNGKFRPLHQLGPARLTFIRDTITTHFARPAGGLRPLAGLSLLDIGCGGGLVSEPLFRMGATVTGIEPAEDNIAAARLHAAEHELDIDYRATTAEAQIGRAHV